MKSVGELVAHLSLDPRNLIAGLRTSQASLTAFSASATRGLSAITSGFGLLGGAIGTAGVAIALKKITSAGVDFERSMIRAGAVMRATDDELDALTATARKMGETTEWTASNAAEALGFLGMAGFNAAKSMKALPGMLNLATASGVDLGRSADIATNALTAMNLPVEQLSRVNDVFVGTITRSNTNMEMLAESFKYAAPMARAAGYSIEELSGLIGMLGNAGIQGSMAGTQLAEMFRKSGQIARKFGMESADVIDVLKGLAERGYDAQEAILMFGGRAGKAAGVLYELTQETRDFQRTLTKTTGEAKTLAEKIRSDMQGAFDELKSTIETVAIDIYGKYREELKATVTGLTAWIREHKEEITALGDSIKFAFESIGWYLNHAKVAIGTVAKALGSLTAWMGTSEEFQEDAFILVKPEEIEEARQQLRALKNDMQDTRESAVGSIKKVAGDITGEGDAEGGTGGTVSLDFDMEGADRLGADIEKYLDDMRSLRDAETQMYQSILQEGSLTGTELERVWGHYSGLRMQQIVQERDAFIEAGMSSEAATDAMLFRFRELDNEMREVFDGQIPWMEQWAYNVANIMNDTLNDVFIDAFKGELKSLSDYAGAIANQIFSVLSQRASTEITGALFRGLSIPGFQSGGLVTKPTLATVGEHEPEAIVPLSRVNDERFWDSLGVNMSTSNNQATNVNVTVQAQDMASFNNSDSQIAAQIMSALNAAGRDL